MRCLEIFQVSGSIVPLFLISCLMTLIVITSLVKKNSKKIVLHFLGIIVLSESVQGLPMSGTQGLPFFGHNGYPR